MAGDSENRNKEFRNGETNEEMELWEHLTYLRGRTPQQKEAARAERHEKLIEEFGQDAAQEMIERENKNRVRTLTYATFETIEQVFLSGIAKGEEIDPELHDAIDTILQEVKLYDRPPSIQIGREKWKEYQTIFESHILPEYKAERQPTAENGELELYEIPKAGGAVLEIEYLKNQLAQYRGVKTLSLGARQERMLLTAIIEAHRYGGVWGALFFPDTFKTWGIARTGGRDKQDATQDFDLLAEARFRYRSKAGGFNYGFLDRAAYINSSRGTIMLYRFNPHALGDILSRFLSGDFDGEQHKGKYLSIPEYWARQPLLSRQEMNFRNWLRNQKPRIREATAYTILITAAKHSENKFRSVKGRREKLEQHLENGKKWGKIEWYKIDDSGRGLKGWKVKLKILEGKKRSDTTTDTPPDEKPPRPSGPPKTPVEKILEAAREYRTKKRLIRKYPGEWAEDHQASVIEYIKANVSEVAEMDNQKLWDHLMKIGRQRFK